MVALERFCRIVWPGPGRLKFKRCFILSVLIGFAIFMLIMLFYFEENHVDVERYVKNQERHQIIIEMKKNHMDSNLPTQHLQASHTPIEGTSVDTDDVMTEVESLATQASGTTVVKTHKTTNLLASTFHYKKIALQLPENWNMVPIIDYKAAKVVIVNNGGIKPLSVDVARERKHLMILGHYEQLGKTTVNYMLAARLAFLMKRDIVKPYVADSRFCGLTTGWTGSLRSGTRAFKPLDLYYNVSSLQKVFSEMSLANMEYLDTFKDSCSFSKNGRRIVVIYFWYQNSYLNKYLMLSSSKLAQIKKVIEQSNGWVDCSFINSHLKIDKRIGKDMKAGNQYCVDPEKVTDWKILENKILKNEPCVLFHQWRGTGYQRTHFNITFDVSPENMLQLVKPSNFVISEVLRSLEMIGQHFVGIHIRSERQLLWYSIDKWLRCMNILYQQAKKIASEKSLKVFISSDIGAFGSDQLSSNLNHNQLKIINAKYEWLVRKLNAITYSVLRPKHYIWTDRGLVALIQLHILSQASFLITLGAGTFQKWITDTFKARRYRYGDQTWTITKVCFSELKNWQELKNVKKSLEHSTKES